MDAGKVVRVAVNGYGVIGKRVADAVTKQNDMLVAGVVDVVADWRPRADLYEVALWEGMLKVQGNELFYGYMVDNQAIVVPETIDAIRALTQAEIDGKVSIAKTDAAMGIGALLW